MRGVGRFVVRGFVVRGFVVSGFATRIPADVRRMKMEKKKKKKKKERELLLLCRCCGLLTVCLHVIYLLLRGRKLQPNRTER